MSIISKYIHEGLLHAKATAKDRVEAIRLSGDLLVRNNLAKEAYSEGMIATLKEHGPYFVIAPGIAMPHARPEDGALEMGVSIVTLKEPVVFGHSSNDPVEIVIGLCAVDHEQHLELLSKVVDLLSDETLKEALLQAGSAQEMLNVIERGDRND
ncbi:MAG: PTS sugar transporter subunit IIA [Bacillota bacterium]